MKKKSVWLAVFAVLLAANLAFIWGNSALPGEASREISGNAMSWLGFLVSTFGEYGEKVLRKLAHLAEFASLGFLMTGFFRLLGKNSLLPVVLGGLFTACVDETIQIFSPERASSLMDVWIDMGGFAAGIVLLLLGQLIIMKRKSTFGG